MAFLKNSTNIPDKLVAIMVAFAMPPDCAEFITSITIKNKRRGNTYNGRWGYYYFSDGKLVVIVPRAITKTHVLIQPHLKNKYVINNRAEFLVMVLAHEMRHAWQAKHWNTPASSWKLRQDRLGDYAKEADAEFYEMDVLERWRRMFTHARSEVSS